MSVIPGRVYPQLDRGGTRWVTTILQFVNAAEPLGETLDPGQLTLGRFNDVNIHTIHGEPWTWRFDYNHREGRVQVYRVWEARNEDKRFSGMFPGSLFTACTASGPPQPK